MSNIQLRVDRVCSPKRTDISAVPATQIILRDTMRGVGMKPAKSKNCTKCNALKSSKDFPKETRTYDGKRCQCKECLNQYEREHYANSESRRFSRFATMIKRKWGITGMQYKTMLKSQKGVCAICGKANINKNRRLAVDHCHKSNKIRGLLCGKCNIGIGQFNDNPKLLRKAALYIESR